MSISYVVVVRKAPCSALVRVSKTSGQLSLQFRMQCFRKITISVGRGEFCSINFVLISGLQVFYEDYWF